MKAWLCDWRWNLAGALWSAALISFFLPGVSNAAVAEFGDVRFSFSQALILFAVGLAWGDNRHWRATVDTRLNKIEMKLEPPRERS
jgi:hypothetical protein